MLLAFRRYQALTMLDNCSRLMVDLNCMQACTVGRQERATERVVNHAVVVENVLYRERARSAGALNVLLKVTLETKSAPTCLVIQTSGVRNAHDCSKRPFGGSIVRH